MGVSCADPAALPAAGDALGPADVQAFFDRWSQRRPGPMTGAERAAGYAPRLAICPLEVSLPQVFDRPGQGRHLFEAVLREHLDVGLRPTAGGCCGRCASPAPRHRRPLAIGPA